MSFAVGFTGSVFALSLSGLLLYRVLTELYRPSPVNTLVLSPVPSQWRRKALTLTLMFLLSRVVIYLLAWYLSGRDPAAFREALVGGDCEHYIYLAQNGYTSVGEEAKLIVFYPLYPLLIRFVMLLVPDAFVSGVIISNVCTFGACLTLFRWVWEESDADRALTSVLLMLLYPFSMFTLSCYTEGLFLFLSLLCVYSARRGRFLRCAVFGFLAALTRTQGLLLFIPSIYEWWIRLRDRIKAPGFFAPFSVINASDARQGLSLLLIPAGFAVFLGLNTYYFHDPFAFFAFEAAPPWYQGIAFFGNNLSEHIQCAKSWPYLADIIYIPQVVLFFAVCGVVLFGLLTQCRTSLLLYAMVYLLVSYSASWLISGARYLFADFPIYIILAIGIKKARNRIVLILVMIPFMAYYLLHYLLNYAIM